MEILKSLDLFTCLRDLRGDHKPGEFRAVIGEAVKKLSAPNVVHIDASRLLTRPDGLGPDLLHPTSRGFAAIAVRLTAEMKKTMGVDAKG